MRWGSALAGAAGASLIVLGAQIGLEQVERRTVLAEVATLRKANHDPTTVTAIPKSNDGHFWALTNIGGASVRALVDTGSTLVALTAHDAKAIGLSTENLRFSHPVDTAAGRVTAAQVRLPVITVGGIVQRQVDAIIVPQGLEHSLLGMSFLSRLSRFEATQDGLYLLQ